MKYLLRNRIAYIDEFGGVGLYPEPPGVDLARFTLVCKWFGCRQLFDGVLGDLLDSEIGGSDKHTRHYINSTLWSALALRLKIRILTLLGLDRYLSI